jgi:hypothetical protein
MSTETPRTDAAQARMGFGDMAIMERQLKAVTDALRGMMAEFDNIYRPLDPDLSSDRPRIAAREAIALLDVPSPFKP